MKNHRKFAKRLLAGRFRIGLLAAVVLMIGAFTVLAFNAEFSWVFANAGSGNKTLSTVSSKQRPLVTVNDRGETVVLNRQTGENRELSQDESRRLAEGLKQILNRSTDGLVEVVRKDGSVSIDLKGHFHSAMVVRKEADGSLTHSCIDDLKAAASFFDIDPSLLGVEGPVTKFTPTKTEER